MSQNQDSDRDNNHPHPHPSQATIEGFEAFWGDTVSRLDSVSRYNLALAAYTAGLANAHEAYLKSQSQVSLHLPHPDASIYRIEGRDGAAGLDVAINPDGTTFLHPVDDAIVGFVLHPEAARDLLRLLQMRLPPAPRSLHDRYGSGRKLDPQSTREYRADEWAKSTTNDPGRIEGVDK